MTVVGIVAWDLTVAGMGTFVATAGTLIRRPGCSGIGSRAVGLLVGAFGVVVAVPVVGLWVSHDRHRLTVTVGGLVAAGVVSWLASGLARPSRTQPPRRPRGSAAGRTGRR